MPCRAMIAGRNNDIATMPDAASQPSPTSAEAGGSRSAGETTGRDRLLSVGIAMRGGRAPEAAQTARCCCREVRQASADIIVVVARLGFAPPARARLADFPASRFVAWPLVSGAGPFCRLTMPWLVWLSTWPQPRSTVRFSGPSACRARSPARLCRELRS